MDWCSVYLAPQVLSKYIYLSPPLIFPTTSMELGQKTARCESLRALLHYVEWDRIVTLAGSKSGPWGLRYRIYSLTSIRSMIITQVNSHSGIDMSLYLDILSWFRANQSELHFHLNDVCLVVKQLIPVLQFLVWPVHANNHMHYITDAVVWCLN